jgi:hypothetical protein
MTPSAGLDDDLDAGASQSPDHLGDESDATLGISGLGGDGNGDHGRERYPVR